MTLSLIAAVAENGVIGRGGQLPWRLSADLRRFKQLTMGCAVVMGRRTWESICRPLPGRRMIVVSRQGGYRAAAIEAATSLDAALQSLRTAGVGEAFIIGGADLYRLALPIAGRLYLTRVHARVEGDAVFPEVDWNQWKCVRTERHEADERNEHDYSFEVYERVAT